MSLAGELIRGLIRGQLSQRPAAKRSTHSVNTPRGYGGGHGETHPYESRAPTPLRKRMSFRYWSRALVCPRLPLVVSGDHQFESPASRHALIPTA